MPKKNGKVVKQRSKSNKQGLKVNKAPAFTAKGEHSLVDRLISKLKTLTFGRADAPQTAQQSIPYREMHRDGICRVNDKLYTKTIAFLDITYQLAQNEEKSAIFEAYCSFLNYFDSSIPTQITCINKRVNLQEFLESVDMPEKDDAVNSIRRENAEILRNHLARGNNGIVKTKYITFGVEAASLREAKPRLERIETDVLAGFKTLGAVSWPLSGLERLEILHAQLHPDGLEKLNFNWSDIVNTGLSTKDFIAPASFDFRDDGTFRIEKHFGAVSFLQIISPELSDRMLADFLDLNTALTVNLHIQSIDQAVAIKAVKAKLSDLDKMRIEEVRPDRALCEVV